MFALEPHWLLTRNTLYIQNARVNDRILLFSRFYIIIGDLKWKLGCNRAIIYAYSYLIASQESRENVKKPQKFAFCLRLKSKRN